MGSLEDVHLGHSGAIRIVVVGRAVVVVAADVAAAAEGALVAVVMHLLRSVGLRRLLSRLLKDKSLRLMWGEVVARQTEDANDRLYW